MTSRNQFPTDIYPYLFIGSQWEAREAALIHTPVRFILDLRGGNIASAPGFKKHICPLSDYGTQNLSEVLPECFAFIEEARAAGSAVVVHCQGGMNRFGPSLLVSIDNSPDLPPSYFLGSCYMRT